MIPKDKDKITLLVPRKFRETFDSFCKTMDFTILSTERTLKEPRITSWKDICERIDRKIGPSYQTPDKFIEKMAKLSPVGTIQFLLTFIVEANDADEAEILRQGWRDVLDDCHYSNKIYQEGVEIIKTNLLPLLYDKGEQESTERNTK